MARKHNHSGGGSEKKLARSSVEASLFFGITLILTVVPMFWWVRGFGLLILLPISVDLVWHSPRTFQWHRLAKIGALTTVVVAITAVAYETLPAEYLKEHPSAPNVRDEVAAWIGHTNWQLHEVSKDSPAFKSQVASTALFAYGIEFPSSTRIVVFQGWVHPDFLQLKSLIPCSPDDLALINTLPYDATDDVFEDIQNKIAGAFAGSKVEFGVTSVPRWPDRGNRPKEKPILKSIMIEANESLPIAQLTELDFVRAAEELDKGTHFMYTTMDLAIRHAVDEQRRLTKH